MDINRPLAKTFPDLLDCVPGAGYIRSDKAGERITSALQKISRQAKRTADKGRSQLRFPFFDLRGVLDKFDIALYDSRPRKVAPSPELRSGRTCHPRDGGCCPLMCNY